MNYPKHNSRKRPSPNGYPPFLTRLQQSEATQMFNCVYGRLVWVTFPMSWFFWLPDLSYRRGLHSGEQGRQSLPCLSCPNENSLTNREWLELAAVTAHRLCSSQLHLRGGAWLCMRSMPFLSGCSVTREAKLLSLQTPSDLEICFERSEPRPLRARLPLWLHRCWGWLLKTLRCDIITSYTSRSYSVLLPSSSHSSYLLGPLPS